MAKEYVSGTFTEDGSSSSVLLKGSGLAFIGGAGGTTFGGGTVTIQAKGPDGQWYDSTVTTDEPDVLSLQFALPVEVRITLADSSSPDLDYAIQSDNESYRD